MKALLLALIRFYRRALSPLRPPCCRFIPTCSNYALEALEKHGVIKGCGLAVWRVLRCNPFGGKGYDPVPEPSARRKARMAQREKRKARNSEEK